MIPELNLTAARQHADGLGAAGRALSALGFDERAVCAWYGVPLVSDAHHVPSPPGRARRGLGAHIALWVAGEEVERGALAGLPEGAMEALLATGLLDESDGRLRAGASLTPFLGALVLADRLDARGPDVVRPPDLSAWNVAASLPAGALRMVDAGCGAGAILLVAARRGGEVIGFDVDARALAFAALNLQLGQVPAGQVRLELADVRDTPAGLYAAGATCVFNAPLLRAEMAGDAPLYLHAPGGEALPLAFLESAAAALPGGEVLCHVQLTDAVWEAASASPFHSVVALEFAHAPDGTPHALLSLRPDLSSPQPAPAPLGAPRRARFRVPLGAALPHLRREIADRLHAACALLADDPIPFSSAVVRPAPWLQLVRCEQHDGYAFRARDLRFGGALLEERDAALLGLCDGRKVDEVALDPADWRRLRALVGRGLLVP